MIDKDKAKYTPLGSPKEHCAICANFERPNKCKIVKGEVSTYGWCKYFAAKGNKLEK